MVGWQEGRHPAHKNPVSLMPRGSVMEWRRRRRRSPRENCLTQVRLENGC